MVYESEVEIETNGAPIPVSEAIGIAKYDLTVELIRRWILRGTKESEVAERMARFKADDYAVGRTRWPNT